MQYGEVAMETPGSAKFEHQIIKKIENIINKKSYEPARAFRDLWSRDVLKVLKLHSPTARVILRSFKTSLVPINHEMHSRSYDFLYV